MRDKLAWLPALDGQFMVKQAYWYVNQLTLNRATSSCSQGTSNYWYKLWDSSLISKINVWAWQTSQDRLPTALNLHNRNLLPHDKCTYLDSEQESLLHILYICSSAQDTRACLHSKERITPNTSVMQLWSNILQERGPQAFGKEILLCWTFWQARNQRLFKAIQLSSFVVAINFQTYLDVGYLTISLKLLSSSSITIINPDPQFAKTHVSLPSCCIYVDGAYKVGRGAVGCYIILNGSIAMSWCIWVGSCTNATYAKTRSIYQGITRAHLLEITSAYLYTDSELLWKSVTTQHLDVRFEWCHLYDICYELLSAINIYFGKISRKWNVIAKMLAKKALKSRVFGIWWEDLPPFVLNLVVTI